MTSLFEFKNSDRFNEIMGMCVKSDSTKIDEIIDNYHLTNEEKEEVLRQVKLYTDELFYHYAMYEISGLDEVPTISRIMSLFDICYFFASHLLNEYLEAI